ncbi:MAG: tail fiber domain-containing protein [Verrucomicrobiota bacterium]
MKAKLITLLPPLLAAFTLPAPAQTAPGLMSYQARVTDAAGSLIGKDRPENRSVTFSFYSDASSTDITKLLYTETQTVTISGGEFSVLIGNGTGVPGKPGPSLPSAPVRKLDAALNATVYEAVFLGITVDDGVPATVDAEISPRQQLVSGAFAMRAKVAESVKNQSVTTDMIGPNAVTLNQLGTNAVNSGKIVDGSIAGADISNNTITFSKLDANTVGVWTPAGNNVYRNGNIGIGESNPGFPLNFGSVYGDKISLYGNSGSHYGLGIQNGLMRIHTDAASSNISFGYGSGGQGAETMRMTGTGNFGIGTTNPSAKLDILGAVKLDGTAGRNYFKDSGKFDGPGLRVGEIWNMYGVYAETGAGALGGFAGASLQNNGLFVDPSRNVGIGTTSPVSRLNLSEDIGTIASASQGTLILDHGNSGGGSSIVFRSAVNRGSDYAYIQYQDDSSIGGKGEKSRLIISTQNDADDDILLSPGGNVGVKTTDTAFGILNVGGNAGQEGIITSVGSRNSKPGYARMYYSAGGIHFDVKNTTNNDGDWKGFKYDGDSNIDYTSDRRLKKDIIDAEPMLERLMRLPFRRFRWKDSTNPDEKHEFGVIAQEVDPLFPDIVGKEEGGMMTVGYTTFATIACKALQELKIETDTAVGSLTREVSDVREQLAEKDQKIADLEARLSALEKLITQAR